MMYSNEEVSYLNQIADEDERESARRVIEDMRENFTNVLNTDAGKAVLWWVISESGMYNAIMSDIDKGKQHLGLKLLEEIQLANPQAWIDIQQNNLNKMMKGDE